MDKINATDVQGMVSHWVATPPNGYLGSGYGSPLKDMLQSPQKTGLADDFLNKLRSDVPLAGALPARSLNMYSIDKGPDMRSFYIEASGTLIALGDSK